MKLKNRLPTHIHRISTYRSQIATLGHRDEASACINSEKYIKIKTTVFFAVNLVITAKLVLGTQSSQVKNSYSSRPA